MITNDQELDQTVEQLQRMYRILADLRRNVFPKNPRMFALMAEGPLDYIRQFQKEINAFVKTPKRKAPESPKKDAPSALRSRSSMLELLIDEALELAKHLKHPKSDKIIRGLQTARNEVERVR